MAKRSVKKTDTDIVDPIVEIQQIDVAHATFYVLGKTPLVMNRMPKKAREHLLLPPPRRNKIELQITLKHNPPAEFNDSIYRCRDPKAPTLIHLPNGCFKKAIAQAALDIPGATKAQIGRLVSIVDPTVYLYGKPYLYMDVVRLAGPSRAPDIRTRAMFPEWACKVTVGYVRKLITERAVVNLFGAAGLITGIGDGRTEKGSRDNGQWDLVSENDKRWKAIVAQQARAVQEKAMRVGEAVDLDSEELLAWFKTEIVRREQEPVVEADDLVEEDEEEAEIAAAEEEADLIPPKRRRRNGPRQIARE